MEVTSLSTTLTFLHNCGTTRGRFVCLSAGAIRSDDEEFRCRWNRALQISHQFLSTPKLMGSKNVDPSEVFWEFANFSYFYLIFIWVFDLLYFNWRGKKNHMFLKHCIWKTSSSVSVITTTFHQCFRNSKCGIVYSK